MPQPTPPTVAQLGATIRALRESSREVSIETLANDAKIHWTYLSQIENGQRNPSWKVLCNLATALDLSILDLVRRVSEDAAVDKGVLRPPE